MPGSRAKGRESGNGRKKAPGEVSQSASKFRVDRIILDILDWLRRTFHWQQGSVERKPFEEVESIPGKYGILKRLRRDTVRDVRTWQFTPYKPKHTDRPNSIHIFCDFLEALPGERSAQKTPAQGAGNAGPRTTHRIEVMEVVGLFEDGSFEYDVLFEQEYLLQTHANRRDEYAIAIVDAVARKLLIQRLRDTDWDFEFKTQGQISMRGSWVAPRSQPKEKPAEKKKPEKTRAPSTQAKTPTSTPTSTPASKQILTIQGVIIDAEPQNPQKLVDEARNRKINQANQSNQRKAKSPAQESTQEATQNPPQRPPTKGQKQTRPDRPGEG